VSFLLKSKFWPLGIAGLAGGLLLVSMAFVPGPVKAIAITNLAVSSTGRWLAAGTHDGHIVICDLNNGDGCTTVTDASGELNDLQFSPDERVLAVANSNIQLFVLDDHFHPTPVLMDGNKYGTVRFNSTGSELLTVNSRSQIELIDIRSRAVLKRFCCSSFYGEVAFLRNDTQLVAAGHWPRIWTIGHEQVTGLTPVRQEETFRPIALDDQRRALFMGSQDGRVYEWSLDTATLLKRSPAQPDYVDTIAIVPSAQLVAYCSFGQTIRLWSIAGDRISEIPKVKSTSNLVAFSNDGSILFGTQSGTVERWNLRGFPRRIKTLSLTRQP
jgi:WD40 repeat protein